MNALIGRSRMDKPGKYAAALAAIEEPEVTPPTVLLPVKAPVPSGKRSTPGWKRKPVLLKEESVDQALARLKGPRRQDRLLGSHAGASGGVASDPGVMTSCRDGTLE